VAAPAALLGYAASRAHHADVGAQVPGSMPADFHDARGGGRRDRPSAAHRPLVDELAAAMRQPAQRRADLRAQVAPTPPACVA
jgi:N-methylhydantoinase B/oxoprolinase/acetone carboxylase alpha subunit